MPTRSDHPYMSEEFSKLHTNSMNPQQFATTLAATQAQLVAMNQTTNQIQEAMNQIRERLDKVDTCLENRNEREERDLNCNEREERGPLTQ